MSAPPLPGPPPQGPPQTGPPGNPAPRNQMPIPVMIPVGMTPLVLGRHPQMIACPMCGATMMTNTNCRPSTAGWIFFAVLCCTAGLAAFSWIPLLCLQDVEHTCSLCGAMVGVYLDPTCR